MKIVECVQGKGCKCGRPAYRYHGKRWQCVRCWRFDTMRECARYRNKTIPSKQWLDSAAEKIESDDMRCPHCRKVMVWTGEACNSVVSLQHNRDGSLSLVCMLCNQQHDDCADDSFWSIPPSMKLCPKCNTVKNRSTGFYKKSNGLAKSYCIDCKRAENKAYWARRSNDIS